MSENSVLPPTAKTEYVLDSWPVMEWLKDRLPTADYFDAMIERAGNGEISLLMSVINVGEVFYNSAQEWGIPRAEEILSRMEQLPITIFPATDEEVLLAARLKASHRKISYADCFAANLAIRYGCRVITGDPDFLRLQAVGLLDLEWLSA
jgi:predicted nucleic acid-binding protein